MSKQNDAEMQDEILEEEAGPRVYELGFHLDPELPSEEVKKAYREVRDLIAGKGALVAEGEPLQIQLAYTISRMETSGRRDFDSAHFAWIVYETSAANHEEIIEAAKADKRIIRFIDLATSKEAARHAEELRELSAMNKGPETQEEAEAAAGAELDAALESAGV